MTTVVLELPFDPSTVPAWAWWTAAACVWYPLAGLCIRRIRRKGMLKEDNGEPVPGFAYAQLWALSPVFALGITVAAVVLAAFYTLWTVGHFASLGGIPAPWEQQEGEKAAESDTK